MAFFVSFNMYRRPEYLQNGDQIVIIAPGGRVKEGGLELAIQELQGWGLKIEIADHVWQGHDYFSASDKNRLTDLQDAMNSNKYKAVFCARGGYGLTRIIDQVDFSLLRKWPKWIIGFSDVTTLQLALSSQKLQSIHAVMPAGFGGADQRSTENLQNVLFGDHFEIKVATNSKNRKGVTLARMIGGNLSLLSASIGTKYEVDTTDRILFIEEIDEYLYKIDRMLGQLNRSGKLSNLKGLVVGHMSKLKDTTVPFGAKIEDLILDHIAQYDYPVMFDTPTGHEPLNLPIVQEGMYQMEVRRRGSVLRMI